MFKYPDPPPVLPSFESFSIRKRPIFSSVVETTVSGRETTIARQAYPLWEFNLKYEGLRDKTQNINPYIFRSPYSELRQVSQLFSVCRGQYGRFFFDDFSDNSRSGQVIAIGDGVKTIYQIVRSVGTGFYTKFTEPVGGVNVNRTIRVYLNGIEIPASGNWSVGDTILTFVSPPGLGVEITMDFYYYYFCRFLEDLYNFEEFNTGLFTLQEFKFRSVKD